MLLVIVACCSVRDLLGSLCAEGLHGLNSGSPAGGEGCGQQDREDDEGGGGCERQGVIDTDSVELAAEETREKDDGWERDDGGDSGDESHLTQHRDDDAGARCSQGEADTDLAGALLGGVGEHTVEADGCEDECQDGEAYGEDGEGALTKRGELGLSFHGAQAADYESGIEVANSLSDGGFDCLGRLRGLDVDLYAAGMFSLCIGTVDGGTKFRATIRVTNVADHSDDNRIGFGVGT